MMKVKVKANKAAGFHDVCETNFKELDIGNTEEKKQHNSSHLTCYGAVSTMF